MILQTGMRTDIPAFYSQWFLNRLKAGFVLVRNPYNPSQVTKYSLSPDVVDCISFCTKNPVPICAAIAMPIRMPDGSKPTGFATTLCLRSLSEAVNPET